MSSQWSAQLAAIITPWTHTHACLLPTLQARGTTVVLLPLVHRCRTMGAVYLVAPWDINATFSRQVSCPMLRLQGNGTLSHCARRACRSRAAEDARAWLFGWSVRPRSLMLGLQTAGAGRAGQPAGRCLLQQAGDTHAR